MLYWLSPVFGTIAMAGYFLASLFTGDQGLPVLVQTKSELAQLETQQAELAEQRDVLSREIKLLTDPQGDVSLIEERARVLLNYGYPDEIYVPLDRFDRDDRPWRR